MIIFWILGVFSDHTMSGPGGENDKIMMAGAQERSPDACIMQGEHRGCVCYGFLSDTGEYGERL